MLRILNTVSPVTTTIRLEGKLLRPWIAEVQASIASARLKGPLRLNLAQLRFADEDGLNLLRALQSENTEMVEVPPLIAALLRRSSSYAIA